MGRFFAAVALPTAKALSTLATILAEFGDSHRFWRQSPNLATIVASVGGLNAGQYTTSIYCKLRLLFWFLCGCRYVTGI